MVGAKGSPTSMVSTYELSKSIGEPIPDPKLYRSTVGALQYAAITRPDISFAVNKASQYMADPLDTHWRAVKRIVRYLSGTPTHGIHINKSNATMFTAFCDSDWASDIDDRRSTSGYCTYYGGNLISWSVKKQQVVARSSTEAEYRSLAHLTSELTWFHSLLDELKLAKTVASVVWIVNISAIALASNPVLHARTKHIELDMHFVRDKVLAKDIELRHVPTSDQVADILTKPLSSQSYVRLRDKLGVIERSTLGLKMDISSNSRMEARGNIKEPSEVNHSALSAIMTNKTLPNVPRLVDKVCQAQDPSCATMKVTCGMQDHTKSWRDTVASNG